MLECGLALLRPGLKPRSGLATFIHCVRCLCVCRKTAALYNERTEWCTHRLTVFAENTLRYTNVGAAFALLLRMATNTVGRAEIDIIFAYTLASCIQSFINTGVKIFKYDRHAC
jgi:hypothetical protein